MQTPALLVTTRSGFLKPAANVAVKMNHKYHWPNPCNLGRLIGDMNGKDAANR
jgi:hypothetical protein